jgi:hypothetical protein
MSYVVKYRDKTETTMDNERGEKLKYALTQTKPPIMIEIGDKLVRASEILSVQKAVEPEIDVKSPKNWDEVLQLTGKPICRGKNSIQNHINQIAKDEGDGWEQRILDDKWREAVRLELREASSEGWCDFKQDECACQ